MNEAVELFLAERASLSLPKTARTRNGIEFSTEDVHWNFRDATTLVSVNFSLLPESCALLLPGLKKTLLWYLENRSASGANRLFTSFLWFARQLAIGSDTVIERISPEDIVSIKISSEKAEYRLAGMRAFLIKWSELGAPGIGEDVAYVLKRLTLKQHPVGVAVATLDPMEGPLTDLEFEAIQAALNNAYAKDEIDSEDLLLCYLLMALGARPVQLASLKCCDLIVPENPDGDYVLKVPRAKQREQFARGEFKWRKLTRQMGEALAAHVRTLQAQFVGRLHDVRETPMFPQRHEAYDLGAPGIEYHRTSANLSRKIVVIFTKLRVPSERLAKPIPVTPIRMRRTFATRAAEEGWPVLIIAELMDHSDTRYVEVYAGLTSRIRAQFSRKIAMEMAPLAMAFSGRIISNEAQATRPGSGSRIVDLRIDRGGASMGSCGSHTYCGFARPIACYGGCYDFEPWLDGPHEAALDYMLARRAHLMATTDARIASINDRAILGCAQIILRCRQIVAEEGRP